MEIPILNDIATICALSILIIFIFNKLKIPSIIGFLLVGTVAGPYGLGLISKVHDVELMAEIGIVLLLFTIGIEFSLKSLFEIKKAVLLGGSFQVFLTILSGTVLSYFFGLPFNKAIFVGFLISLSSTAIVLKVLQDKAEVDSPHGKNILAILIFQDIIAIPMMLITPFLSGQIENGFATLYTLVLKMIFIAILVFILIKYVVPQMFYHIVKTKVSELFLISVIGLCIGIALLTSSMGLSLALGAFIAGLIISESEYSHQALGNILPFKDMFTSLFFVSIGMLLDISFFTQNFLLVSALVLISLIVKTIVGIFSSLILGYSLRSAILVGFAISQIGEFSFVLSKVGIANNLIDNYIYQLFLSVSIFTMALTPFILDKSHKISDLILKFPIPEKIKKGIIEGNFSNTEKLKDHIIIIGFGLNGQSLAKVASKTKIPYAILELNAQTVKKYSEKGEPIYYGDSTQEIVLEHLNVRKSRVVVVAISDPIATRKTVSIIRGMDKTISILVRTRYLQELSALYDLGADEVVAEEFETSIEIFSRVLSKYLVPKDQIAKFISDSRKEKYEMVRTISKRVGTVPLNSADLNFSDLEISTLKVSNKSPLIGKTLAELDIRKKYAITILAINRDKNMISNPSSNFVIQANDIVMLVGDVEKVNQAEVLF